jgi:AcrR family transcriptional regulator
MSSTATTEPAPQIKRRRLSAVERRRRILAGAMELFAERGYEGASMVEIARAAGITPAVIYDHFSSKAELQIELLEGQTEELLGFVGAALASAPPELEARLRAGVDAFFCFVENHRYAWRMLFRDPPSDPEVAAAYLRLERRATAGIAAFIEAGATRALAAEEDPAQAAEIFAELLKMSQNGLASWWFDHPEVLREEIVERLMQFCWSGLAARSGQ